MIFTILRPDGITERCQHIPYNVVEYRDGCYAYHAVTERLLGRFDSIELLHKHMQSMTELLEPE